MTACAPQMRIIPPKRELCPKEIYRLTGLVLLECNSRLETPKILVFTPEFEKDNSFVVDFAKIIYFFSGCSYDFFADDICLLSPSFSGLQDLVDICSSYSVPHNIVFNCKKSVGVLFPSKGFVLSQSPKIVLGNKVIDFCDSVSYLGVKISANLSDDEDIFRQVRSSYCAANILQAKFSKCFYVVKNVLFCSYCMPFYACLS